MFKRVSQALATGAAPFPLDGTVAVFDPPEVPVGPDFEGLQLEVISPSAQVHDACARQGVTASVSPGPSYEAALVFLGRSRPFSRFRLAQAAMVVRPGGYVLVDGQKTDGVESALKECGARTQIIDSYVKSHGRLFWFRPEAGFDDWAAIPADWPEVDGFRTGPGVFSADGIDPGSSLLVEHWPKGLKGRGADLGAGWGYLSSRLLASAPAVSQLHLVEDDDRALEAARLNVSDPRAECAWADATTWMPEAPLDFVITNPPFHAGRGADPSIGRAFITAAAKMLARHGRLILVANRHLPYEATLEESFRKVSQLTAQSGYKVIEATGPKSSSKTGAKSASASRRD